MRTLGHLCLSIIFVLLISNWVPAQSTQFTYQGTLKDGPNAANGSYDFEFALFDSLAGGTQTGPTLTRNAVAVVTGVFSVKLDFGNQFPGAGRFLEIKVRLNGQPGITVLGPRQAVDSLPYAIKSVAADTATNVTGTVGIFNGGTGLDFGGVLPPSGLYLRSNGAGWQASGLQASDIPSGFVDTTTNQTIGGTKTFSSGIAASNLTGTVSALRGGTGLDFGGIFPPAGMYLRTNGAGFELAGITVPAGSANYIQNTGTLQSASNFNISGTGTANILNVTTQYNVSGSRILAVPGIGNLFAGINAGSGNGVGSQNTNVGDSAGMANSFGGNNSMFGSNAGLNNTGSNNTFLGSSAGQNNSSGLSNTFVGLGAGSINSTGSTNAFVGVGAGSNNTIGTNNSSLGASAGPSVGNLSNTTAVGTGAVVSQSNAVILGSNADVGIGTSAPKAKLDVTGGNIVMTTANTGIILKSPNNATCRLLTIDNAGAMVLSPIACP